MLRLPAFIALAIGFTSPKLFAQDSVQAGIAMSMQLSANAGPALISKEEGHTENLHRFDLNAGQRAASFNGFREYVSAHLVYPEQARENAIEGRVEVLVSISDKGKILSAKIVEPLGFGCDEAALAVVREMPDWAPAMNFGVPVKGKKVIAIDFRLQ